MRMRIVLLIALLLSMSGWAKDRGTPSHVLRATVKITRSDGVFASGVLVGDADHVVTVAHVTWDAPENATYHVTLYFVGEPHEARHLANHPYADVAIFELKRSILSGLRVRYGRLPKVGQQLRLVGYPKGYFAPDQGTTGKLEPKAESMLSESDLLVASVAPGSSGSGVWDAKGRLVGLVWGSHAEFSRLCVYTRGSVVESFAKLHVETDFWEPARPEDYSDPAAKAGRRSVPHPDFVTLQGREKP